jgi:hypothetical protein
LGAKIGAANGCCAPCVVFVSLEGNRAGFRGQGGRFKSIQEKGDGDAGFDFDRLAVEARGLVAPLADGLHGGVREDGIAAEQFNALDGAVCADDGAERTAPDKRIIWAMRGSGWTRRIRRAAMTPSL